MEWKSGRRKADGGWRNKGKCESASHSEPVSRTERVSPPSANRLPPSARQCK